MAAAKQEGRGERRRTVWHCLLDRRWHVGTAAAEGDIAGGQLPIGAGYG